MNDDWLLDVLWEIEDYAIKNDLTWLIPHIDRTYEAARKELNPNAPIPLQRASALGRRAKLTSSAAPMEMPIILAFPLGLRKQ